MSDYLPQEILLDVFLRLPNKDIGMCMCVCRYWLYLIKNPSFVSSHLKQTISSKKDPLLLLRTRSVEELEAQYSLHIDNEKFGEYKQLIAPSHHDLSFLLIGSCNGLVCFMHKFYASDNTFLLWNPLIRKSVALPKPEVTYETHGHFQAFAGFGFDSRTNDYKVLRIVRLLDAQNECKDEDEVAVPVEVEIFSLNRNSWKNITHKSPQYDIDGRGLQAFVNGAVHWIATQRSKHGEFCNSVLALDMGTEQFRQIMLPECLAKEDPKNLSVFVYKDSSIGVCRRKYFGYSDGQIWALKEYGVLDSWKKLLVFGRLDGGVPEAIGFRRNGAVAFQMHDGDMVSVHPEGLDVKDLRIQGAPGHSFVDSFVESLALLDKPKNAKDGSCQAVNFLQ